MLTIYAKPYRIFGYDKPFIERFDRLWTRDGRLLRLPQEDCCQALSVPPTRKYEPDGGPGMRQILDLLKASDEPEADQRTFLKAQIVFWLLGARTGTRKFQHLPAARRPVPADAALRRHVGAAQCGCRPDPA
jgi:hypothetical protein